MKEAAILVSILVAIIVPLITMFMLLKDGQGKARARRLADAKMNARLLRLNL